MARRPSSFSSTSGNGRSFLLRSSLLLLILVPALIQILFFTFLPDVRLHPSFCQTPPTAETLESKLTSDELAPPLQLFYKSLYLSPKEFAKREKQSTSSKHGYFLPYLGQGHEPLQDESASYCINLIAPFDSGGMRVDFELYLESLPSARPIMIPEEVEKQSSQNESSVVMPPSVIDLYLERHPVDSKYYYNVQISRKKPIWMMQNVEFFDRHELANPDIGVIIVKNRIGLKKVLEYRRRHRMQYSVFYTKHTSADVLDTSIHRDWNSFLHLAGNSPFKNTRVIVRAWSLHPEWPTLYLRVTQHGLCDWIESKYGKTIRLPNVNYKCGQEGHEEIRRLQNTVGIHLCPSETEGFGHYINEARSTGALVLTTNVAPMNELIDNKSGVLVGKPKPWWWQSKGDLFMPLAEVELQELELAIEKIQLMTLEERKLKGSRARARYLEDRVYFYNSMAALEESLCQDQIRIDTLLPYFY